MSRVSSDSAGLSKMPSLTVWESREAQAPAATIALVGDFLPAFGLAVPTGQTWSSMGEALSPYFNDVALTFINLECPVNADDLPPQPKAGTGANLRGPAEALDYLTEIHAQVVGIANNHMVDYGSQGVTRTRQALTQQRMIPLGSGQTLSDAPEIHIWQGPDDIRVGFWAAAKVTNQPATQSRDGTEPATLARARQALGLLRQQGATVTIALLHAGHEHTNYPEPDDVAYMSALASEGFDVVAACHSHRVSGYQAIQHEDGSTAFCFYGLGQLSSGCMYSPLEQEGLVARIGLNQAGQLARVEVVPIHLSGVGWGAIPSPEKAEAILQRCTTVTADIADGSYREKFYADISDGLLTHQLKDFTVAFGQGGFAGVFSKLGRLRLKHLRRLWHALRNVV